MGQQEKIKNPFKPGIEKKLYGERRDLWAITRVMIHAPDLKRVLWEHMAEEDKRIIMQAVEDSRLD